MQTYKLAKLLLVTTALSSVMLASATTLSGAADAPPRIYSPPPPPYFLWTGFYVGAHIGAGWSDDNGGGSGFIGGGQVGYNYQINHWVFGVEGDLSGTTIGGSASTAIASGGVVVSGGATGHLDWIATLAPRVGYAFDNWLVYGKVGAAWAHASASGSVAINGIQMASFTADSTSSGAVFGVGTEYALTPNWSAKAEYNVFDFGSNSGNFQTFKAGVNYRFGGF
jgi:outer membrane immunogenic protein